MGTLSLTTPGAAAVIVVRPRTTSWALLEEGDIVFSLGDASLSEVHVLIRCTELSKLLHNAVNAVNRGRDGADSLYVG